MKFEVFKSYIIKMKRLNVRKKALKVINLLCRLELYLFIYLLTRFFKSAWNKNCISYI